MTSSIVLGSFIGGAVSFLIGYFVGFMDAKNVIFDIVFKRLANECLAKQKNS